MHLEYLNLEQIREFYGCLGSLSHHFLMELATGLKARADSRFRIMQSLNAAESVESSIGAKDACASSSSWQSPGSIMPCTSSSYGCGDFHPFLKPNVVLSPSTGGKLGAVVYQQGSSCIVNCDLEYCQEDSIAESG